MAEFLIAYAAHTPSCSFLLDEEGFCRKIVLKNPRRDSRNARRCVNAQYVASLDLREAGGLVEMPRPGASMLFARIDERGRVALVRTGPVLRFETIREPMRVDPDDDDTARLDPFVTSQSVETSVPAAIIEDLAKREASRRSLALVLDPPSAPSVEEPAATTQPDPDYSDESIRTRKMQSITPEEAMRLLALHGRDAPVKPPPPPPSARRAPPADARSSRPDPRSSRPEPRSSQLDARGSRPDAPPPASAPRSSRSRPPPASHARVTEPPSTAPANEPPATLRTPPPVDMGIFDDEDDYATVMKRRRGMLPPRSDAGGARRRG